MGFYFKYAWRSVLRGKSRSFFAILCVAVGVAALVAIQVLEQSINDTLIGDAKGRAAGDLIVTKNGNADINDTNMNTRGFSADRLAYFDQLKSQGQIQDWTSFDYLSNVRVKGFFLGSPDFYMVDPAKYPLYGQFKIFQPANGDFQQLLKNNPNGVIIGKTLWDKQHYQLGQELTVASGQTGKSVNLKIVGETDVDVPGVQFSFLGTGFISQQTGAQFLSQTEAASTKVFVKTATNEQADKLKNVIQQAGEGQTTISLPQGSTRIAYFNYYNVETATEVQAQLQEALDQVKPLLTYVGLLSLLIGGIGVVNTMLVVIGRRTTEIATVKALGLKKWQTVLIFTIEAGCIGVIGSVVGIILGEMLSLVFNRVAEGIFLRPLVWSLYPLPILTGLIVGVVTAMVFGFLPSYAAGKVRPGVVLRLQSGALPGVGGIASVLIVLLMTTALGLTAGLITNNVLLGLAISFGTLIASLILIGLLWVLVWLVGLLPAPLGPSFKMAMRSFSRHRGRTATTVAVIVVGIFCVSFVVILAEGIKETFKEVFDVNLGYNVVALNLVPTDRTKLQSSLAQLPGYQNGFVGNRQGVEIQQINGQDWQAYYSKLQNSGGAQSRVDLSSDIQLSGRDFINGQVAGASGKQKVINGRNLEPGDADKKVMVVNLKQATSYNLKVGDKLSVHTAATFGRGVPSGTAAANDKSDTFEIVGILDNGNQTISLESPFIVPFQATAALGSQQTFVYLLIDRTQLTQALNQLQTTQPTLFILNISDFIDEFSRLLDQFLAFPTMLSLLSLFSGAVLIANNVALAMLERRTEIGVLKAIGAKQRRIMTMILWESSLTGFLGGLLGVGLALLILLVSGAVGSSTGGRNGGVTINWSPLVAGLLVLMSIGLAVVATIASAWSAVREKPLVVLRYE